MLQRISKNRIKQLQLLSKKKHRDTQKLFIAEGEKIIQQLHETRFGIQTLVGTPALLQQFSALQCEKLEADPETICKISTLVTAREIIAVCEMPDHILHTEQLVNELTLVLDDVQDPGNLGTIIRLASWFGIRQIICSPHSADCYNPKVIQASMGAIAHVAVHYTELSSFLKAAAQHCTIYGTFLEGENIYQMQGLQNGIIVLGNEGKGISDIVTELIDQKLFIPNFTYGRHNVESLNVSMAAAIICSEFRRNVR